MRSALANVTVVVPVGPGDRVSPVLRAQLAALPPEAELYIAVTEANADDGAGAALPQGPRPQVLSALASRAAQQNAGAAASARDWLWFVHADSQLAADTLPALAAFVQRNERAMGYFDLRFLGDGPALMKLNAFGAHLRSRWLRLPFGDQGLVLPRALFQRLGGFDTALSSGEDHDLVWRARRAGVPLRAVGASLFTSARRYAEHGWWATTALHLRQTRQQARRFSRADTPRREIP